MDLHVSLDGPGDLASRIYHQVRDAILDGRLRPGERLPPTRELARGLAVARNTVAVAYERLAAEEFVVARVGAGTFVATPRTGAPVTARRAPGGRGVRPRPVWDEVAPAVAAPTGDTPPVHDFRVGAPDAGLFPFATWRRLVADELRASAVRAVAGYADPGGHPRLREAVARHTGVSRSVRADAEDVLVTQGAQQALDLLGRVLLEPGDLVAVEEPGYPAARLLFRSLGARVVGVPVDGEGLVVDALPDTARLVHVTPSHQFPLGVPMSPTRRAALLEWAARRDAVIVEDDYDSEFRFGDRPLQPLQSLDRTGRVVYVGTFSKTLLPLLRLGFLIAPAALRPALRAAKRLTDWHGDHIGQAALARFIDSGELSRHVRRATRVYAQRRERVVAALRADLADWLDAVPSAAGLHLAATLKPDVDADVAAVLGAARASGVAVENLAAYCADGPPRPGVVLGYGAVTAEGVTEGLRLLADHFRRPPG
ncbi:GntR family transcriptional regulator/MocR family aminotransferase [Saccharothrix coeruleofusca]|uniref:MocR-like pyridoxine biosynthesis transcription factor PdxR n=1 Tax=Saccharothrix coeruleofusca TaxID=33919 RepID=UPI001AE75830|nr:PLP-dependent aminotransferase family protein [Saccharothrix coeruleofusca]MBP2333934.1 GntR family transcriptional regulator/MocR family aminotransferase [Saccharothrix coeruleofusca]